MRSPLLVDGRNLLDPQAATDAGFVYEAIGRRAPQQAEAAALEGSADVASALG
jgi:hypothetical protein